MVCGSCYVTGKPSAHPHPVCLAEATALGAGDGSRRRREPEVAKAGGRAAGRPAEAAHGGHGTRAGNAAPADGARLAWGRRARTGAPAVFPPTGRAVLPVGRAVAGRVVTTAAGGR
ncbi:hypothetical protein GCM10027294_10930 [Marinactinospora endophytica]